MNSYISILFSVKNAICPFVPCPPAENNAKLSLNFFQVFKDYELDTTNLFVTYQTESCTPPWLVECNDGYLFNNPSVLIPVFPIQDDNNILHERILNRTLFNSKANSNKDVNEFRHMLFSNILLKYTSIHQISLKQYPEMVQNTLRTTYKTSSKSAFVIARPSELLPPYLCIYKTFDYNDHIDQFPPLIKTFMRSRHRNNQRNEELDSTSYLNPHSFHFEIDLNEIYNKCDKMVISPGMALLVPKISNGGRIKITFTLIETKYQQEIESANKYIYTVQIHLLDNTGIEKNITQLNEYVCKITTFEDKEQTAWLPAPTNTMNAQNEIPLGFFTNSTYGDPANTGYTRNVINDSKYDRRFDGSETPLIGAAVPDLVVNPAPTGGANLNPTPTGGANTNPTPTGDANPNPGTTGNLNPATTDGANPNPTPTGGNGGDPNAKGNGAPTPPDNPTNPDKPSKKFMKIFIPCLIVVFIIIIIVIIVIMSKSPPKK